ncbi:DinB family protein, partial [Paenibacillus sp. AR247]|uniref:DinB family protein n=1 Tax=Paenibacillus sp. AR247 TaxID=1631599 RepID=UPI000D451E55
LAGTTAQLPAFEQDAWVSGQHANQGGTPDILDAFHALLTYNTLLLQRLTPEDLAKNGVNPRGQTVSVADLVNGFIRHVENHLGQIERIKQAAALV